MFRFRGTRIRPYAFIRHRGARVQYAPLRRQRQELQRGVPDAGPQREGVANLRVRSGTPGTVLGAQERDTHSLHRDLQYHLRKILGPKNGSRGSRLCGGLGHGQRAWCSGRDVDRLAVVRAAVGAGVEALTAAEVEHEPTPRAPTPSSHRPVHLISVSYTKTQGGVLMSSASTPIRTSTRRRRPRPPRSPLA